MNVESIPPNCSQYLREAKFIELSLLGYHERAPSPSPSPITLLIVSTKGDGLSILLPDER